MTDLRELTENTALLDRIAFNDRIRAETGHLFGLAELRRKTADPGVYEAIWNILLNICNTGWNIGCRVSSSAIASEGGDALWALHLPTGEAICTSRGITAHPGLLAHFVRSLIEAGYEDNPGIEPGDIFENNDPHYGGIHPVDFDSAIPIHYRGELVGWATAVTHVMDAGYILPGSIGFMNPDCFADGVPVTMEKIGARDAFYPWYQKRITSRTRVPEMVMGDARGRLAGSIAIRERVLGLIEKYGLDLYKDITREYVEDGRRYAVKRIRTQAIPGRLRKSNFKDLAMKGKRVIMPDQDIDCLFNLPLDVTIDGDAHVRFSLRGASGWVPFGQNITPPAVASALLNTYSHIVGFDMFNSGSMAAWDLEMPPAGSWANPYPANYFASSGVAWAPAVMWMSSLYETFGRVYHCRGYVEEVAAGAGTTMTAEFAGVNQFGVYLAGLTLEQASNGSPARGMADGENSAWCIYTPNADFGNAEISELYYPIMFLGRNVEPDSGGYGKHRGGLGHTAVWMIMNTPGVEYSCGCAGMRSKVVANHGMFGAYPAWPDRPSYASDTNLKELIDRQQPLVHERGDPEHPDLALRMTAGHMETDVVAPFVTPGLLHEYDVVVHPISGGQALGDPIGRSVADVVADLDRGWTRPRIALEVHGVVASQDDDGRWHGDDAATAVRRAAIREQRKGRAVPFSEWWREERGRVQAKEAMDPAVLQMWRSSMALSPDYGDELRAFWHLPADFEF